jgi:hypothetical protein
MALHVVAWHGIALDRIVRFIMGREDSDGQLALFVLEEAYSFTHVLVPRTHTHHSPLLRWNFGLFCPELALILFNEMKALILDAYSLLYSW